MNTVLITGGSGLVGRRLSTLMIEKGYQVRHLSRNPKDKGNIRVFKWDISDGYIDPEALKGVNIVVHLAGADIMEKRWTPERKKELVSSRTDSLNLIYDFLDKNKHQVKTLISSSAQGYYPPNQNKILIEGDPAGSGYMGQLSLAWEQAAYKWENLGIKVSINRIGLVMAREGGVMEILIKPIKKGIASYFGKGTMMYPWIHIDDLCGMMIFEIENDHVKGTFNAAAPNAVTQKEMNKAIAKQFGKNIFSFPVPVFILRLMMGERFGVMVDSFHLSADKIQNAGYNFDFPKLDEALDDLL